MAPLDDIQDKIEHERSTEEDEDIDFGDLSHPDALNTQQQESQSSQAVDPRPSIHAATLSDAAYQDIYTNPRRAIQLERRMYYWPVKKKCMDQSLLLLPRATGNRQRGKDVAGKFTAEPRTFGTNTKLFNYLKGKSSEGDAVEIMYQIERLMERVTRTRMALGQEIQPSESPPRTLRAIHWRSVLRFAEHQFVDQQELLTRFRARLFTLFPNPIQYGFREKQTWRGDVSADNLPMDMERASEPSPISLSLDADDQQMQ